MKTAESCHSAEKVHKCLFIFSTMLALRDSPVAQIRKEMTCYKIINFFLIFTIFQMFPSIQYIKKIPWLFPDFLYFFQIFPDFSRFSLTFFKKALFSRFSRFSLTAGNPVLWTIRRNRLSRMVNCRFMHQITNFWMMNHGLWHSS